jgi:hypothetical protein
MLMGNWSMFDRVASMVIWWTILLPKPTLLADVLLARIPVLRPDKIPSVRIFLPLPLNPLLITSRHADNYMDYSDDNCLTEFTNGQFTRLQGQMSMYRGVTF